MVLSLDSVVNFKKYSGRSLNQIICGFSSGNQEELLDDFLKDYVEFFSKKTDYDILIPAFFTNSFYKKKIIRNDDFCNTYLKFDKELDYMKSIHFVDYNSILMSTYEESNIKIKVSHFLKESLTTEFQYEKPFFGSYKNKKKPSFSNRTKNCFADPQYISWCISNLKNFAIDRDAIEKEYEISSLLKMDVIPINHELNDTQIHIQTLHGYGIWYDKTCSIICKPVLKKSNFKFNEKIKEKNYENLERIEFKPFRPSHFSYNEDNWLRDAAGTDDPETMNDVYWNLD